MNPETPTQTLSDRLLKGARMLGNLWRSKLRCARGWAIEPQDLVPGFAVFGPCLCPKKTKFCEARVLWLNLALEANQFIESGEHGLADTMTAAQWDATGLTMTVESEKAGTLRLGSKATISAAHLAKLSENPDAAISILALTRAFPKARIEGILEPSVEAAQKAD